MGDDISVSGGGSSSVATEQLCTAAGQVAALAAEASALGMHLARIDDLATPGWWHRAGAPPSMITAERDIDQARIVLGEIELQSRMLGWALNSAADGYTFVELMLRKMLGGALGSVAGAGGVIAPRTLGTMAPIAAGVALAGVDGQDVSDVLSREAAVDAVRAGTMLADDALMGFFGVPRPLALLLGDEGLGIVGLSSAAAAGVGVASLFGLLRETPVALAGSRAVPVARPPAGFADRLTRVPTPDSNGGSQVRIEKYEVAGEPARFEVFIAGTVTFDPVATTEPWDMTSNMSNASGPGSGSYDSVVIAMQQAGVDSLSPVQFTGYSQGGGTAAQLAASGDYNTAGLVTFGGPTGQVELPEGIPTVIVEHSDDLVPALGGAQGNEHAVIVERDVFEGRELPEGQAIPAHHRPNYQHTAELMDASAEARLTEALARLDAFAADPRATVTATEYRFERLPMDSAATTSSAARVAG